MFLARNASYDTATLTHEQFDRFYRQSVNEYTSVIGTDDPDLTDLKKAGTKLLTWYVVLFALLLKFPPDALHSF